MTIRSESVKMSRFSRPLRVALASAGAVTMLLLSACSGDEPLPDVTWEDGGAGTVASDGSYEIFPEGERQAPIEFGGVTLRGVVGEVRFITGGAALDVEGSGSEVADRPFFVGPCGESDSGADAEDEPSGEEGPNLAASVGCGDGIGHSDPQ